MWCVVITQSLFEVGDTYEHNEIRLNKEVSQQKEILKIHTDKVAELGKQLLEAKKQKEALDSKWMDLEETNASLIKDMETTRESNEK